MIKRLKTKKQKSDKNLLEKLIILLIKKGIVSKEDYENLKRK